MHTFLAVEQFFFPWKALGWPTDVFFLKKHPQVKKFWREVGKHYPSFFRKELKGPREKKILQTIVSLLRIFEVLTHCALVAHQNTCRPKQQHINSQDIFYFYPARHLPHQSEKRRTIHTLLPNPNACYLPSRLDLARCIWLVSLLPRPLIQNLLIERFKRLP